MQSFFRRSIVVSLLVFFFCLSACGEPQWIEVRSPHFRVLTDSNAKSGRAVANEFEQMHHVLAVRFQDPEIDSAVPLTIVAGRNGDAMDAVLPAQWKSSGRNIGAIFAPGWERQAITLRLDAFEDHARTVAYTDYTESVLASEFHGLPQWLSTGLGQYFGCTLVDGHRIEVGAPAPSIILMLRNQKLLPISLYLQTDGRVADRARENQFLGQAWAVVHFMIHGKGMGEGAKLSEFIRKITSGVAQADAFREAFGDTSVFDDGLQRYLQNYTFHAQSMALDATIAPETFAVRELKAAEVEYELATVQILLGERKSGRMRLLHALQLDPSLAGAHEELGFAEFDEGNDAEAAKEWQAALAADPASYRSLFALTMQGTPLQAQSYQQLAETRLTLEKIVGLAPKYAAPYAVLALVDWRVGLLQEGYDSIVKAQALAPTRAGYQTLSGYLLLKAKQPEKASIIARAVADQFKTMDHDEAVDLWETIPADVRGAGTPLSLQLPEGAKPVRGRLTELTCPTEQTGKVKLTIVPEGEDAKPVELNSKGHDLWVGFSDTLWWGRDHFSACHHLEGHPVLAAVKDGAVVELEIRNDLPTH